MQCPACHHNNPEGAKFCGECGTKLERLCPSCGTGNPPANKFCHHCGQPLAASPQPQQSPTPPPAVALPTGERRQATIVFSDLSGYRAMNERLDPEEVEALMGRLKEAAVRIVERHGGMVNQFVGDEVLALFGIPTAHEDDPLRAVRAALELHAMVRQMSPEVEAQIGQPLRVHTGIHTGLIVTNQRDERNGRYGITGDTVNTGARLKARADADDILVSAETQRVIAPFFETAALEAIPIKGKTAPVMAYRVIGASHIHTRFEAAAQRGFTPYTGREREQITVVQGWCHAAGSATSYLPFLDALRRGLDLREEDTPAASLEKAVANITAIDPSLEQYLPLYLHLLPIPSHYPLPSHLQGEELRYAVHEALAALPTLYAQRRPTVLILEDWHWADEASDAALRHLIGVIARSPLLVMVTYRPDYQPRWGNLSYHTGLLLHPLDARHTEAISSAVLGAEHLPPGLAALIYDRTGGNPFFIEEVWRSLREAGVVVIEDGRAVLTHALETLTLPDTVQAILRTRLDRLDPDAKEVVRLASVIGRAFGRRLVERLYAGRAPLSQVLETLKALEMIQQTRVLPEAEYMFTDVLTQEVAYETLLLQRRKVLHGLVGEAIEALYPDRLAEQVDPLQYHFSRAENRGKRCATAVRPPRTLPGSANFTRRSRHLNRCRHRCCGCRRTSRDRQPCSTSCCTRRVCTKCWDGLSANRRSSSSSSRSYDPLVIGPAWRRSTCGRVGCAPNWAVLTRRSAPSMQRSASGTPCPTPRAEVTPSKAWVFSACTRVSTKRRWRVMKRRWSLIASVVMPWRAPRI
jgi:class 3 adenylate cyclase